MGKFNHNYEGPYRVSKMLTGGPLILSEMDGSVLLEPVNSDSIKDIWYVVYSCSLDEMKGATFLYPKHAFP